MILRKTNAMLYWNSCKKMQPLTVSICVSRIKGKNVMKNIIFWGFTWFLLDLVQL